MGLKMNKTIKQLIKIILVLGVLNIFSACSLNSIHKQTNIIENISTINGRVLVKSSLAPGSIYVRLYQDKTTHLILINQIILGTDGRYAFNVEPGRYLVSAYIDYNSNKLFDKTEPEAYISYQENKFSFIKVKENQNINVPNLWISGKFKNKNKGNIKERMSRIRKNIGKIVSLKNSMFSKKNASLGLWEPFNFVDNVGGGLLMLQAYEPKKIPVVFVHGILGHSAEFEILIKSLDRKKFQPWVLYYPSGVRLDMVSDYLLSSLNQLQAQYKFSNVHLIAHSMGGLMSRSFLMKQQVNPAFDVSLFMTINSPLYGIAGAASGVEFSPIVVPSWRDVASGSDYVKRVHKWKVPKTIPYYLIFSYLDGEVGDGVVPITSQLSLSLQDEAVKILGFNAQHAGVLKNKEFVRRFNQILARRKHR